MFQPPEFLGHARGGNVTGGHPRLQYLPLGQQRTTREKPCEDPDAGGDQALFWFPLASQPEQVRAVRAPDVQRFSLQPARRTQIKRHAFPLRG